MISVIVPIYNSDKYLKQTVESIINQSYKDLEIILVNDGSVDNSLDVCCELEKYDKRIKVINQKNLGVSVARNNGLKNALGEFIMFVDSDDYIEPEMCKEMLEMLSTDNRDLVVCGMKVITNWSERLIKFDSSEYLTLEELGKNFASLFGKNFFNSMCNKIYKKEYIHEYLKEGLSIGEDLLFNLNYLRNIKSIFTTDKCYYNYIDLNLNSLSKLKHKNEIEIIKKRYKEIFSFCRSYFKAEEYEAYLNELLILEIIASYKKNIKVSFGLIRFFKRFKNELLEYKNLDYKDVYEKNKKIKFLISGHYKLLCLIVIFEAIVYKIKLSIKKVYNVLKKGSD